MNSSLKEDIFDVMDAHKINSLAITRDFDENEPTWQTDEQKILGDVARQVREKDCEQVFFFRDRISRMRLIIAIHSTKAGPALGGCRLSGYPTFQAHLADAIGNPGALTEGLAQSMTWKALLADLKYGGGKALIDADPADPRTKSPMFFTALARALETINKDRLTYITAEDSGINEQDLERISRLTNGKYIAGRPKTVLKDNFKGSGDPGIITALGVIRGMKAACNFLDIGDFFYDKTVAIQGLGSVGIHLAQELKKKYPEVEIIASDIKCDAESTHPDKTYLLEWCRANGVRLVHSSMIYSQKCDIFAPCALRVTIDEGTIPLLRCLIVAGAQNNQLGSEEDGERLLKKGIVYVPDYVINAGGLINATDELEEGGYNETRVLLRVWQIYNKVMEILEKSREDNLPTNIIADRMAREKLASL